MKSIVIEPPSKKQRAFLTAEERIVGYGGARGGGKSWAVRAKSKIMAAAYPGIKQLIVRRTYPELIKNHINILRKELFGVARYSDKDKCIRFPNGSEIWFSYCARDADLEHLQGAEFDIIYIDEATQLSEHQITVIYACCRGANDFPKRMYLTCNPGGQGHGYIKRIFIDKKYKDGEDAEEYRFIKALVDDNEALMRKDPQYKKNLEKLPPKLRKGWLEGSFDIYEGQFFEEFVTGDEEQQKKREWTHVIEPFEIPQDWQIFRSYDFGYAKPFSCGWWAVDYKGVIYRILELYGCTDTPNEGVKWTPDEQFRKIREIERSHPFLSGKDIHGVADPSIWDGSRGDSINDTAMKHGVYFSPGDNSRIAGWMQVRYRLMFDDRGKPQMYVFNNCKDFIRTMPILCFSERNPEDLDTTGEDHIADETRYFCMTRKIKSPKPTKEKEYEMMTDPLNQLTQTNSIRRN